MSDEDRSTVERHWILKTAARLVPEESKGWHRYVMPIGVLALLVSWTMMGELDSLLKGMQDSGGASYGMSSLTTGSPDQKIGALAAWTEWDKVAGRDLLSSSVIRDTYVWIDFGFLVAYSVVLLGVIGGLWRRSEARRSGAPAAEVTQSRPWLQAINGLGYLLLALILLDAMENIGLLIWPGRSTLPSLLAWVITALSWLKMGAALVLLVGIAYVATVAFRPSDVAVEASGGEPATYRRSGTARVRRWIRGLSLFRVPLILLTLLAVLMLAVIPMGFVNQVPDLIRRWSAWHFIVTLVTTGGVIAAVWIISSYAERRYLGRVPRPTTSPSLTLTVALALLAAGIVQAISFAFGLTGLGAVVPALFVLVLMLAQWKLPTAPDRADDGPRIVATGTARVLAASVMGLLGAAMINAAVPELLDSTRVPLPTLVILTIGVVVLGLVSAVVSVAVAGLLRSAWNWLADRGAALGLLISFGLVLSTLLGIMLLPDPSTEMPLWLSLVLGIVVTYSAVGIYLGLQNPTSDTPAETSTGFFFTSVGDQLQFSYWGKVVVLVGMACATATTVWVLADPTVRAVRVGGTGIVMLALAQLAVIGLLLTQFADHAKDADAFAWLGFERIPVFLFLFAWIAVVAVVPNLKLDSYHDVRIEEREALPPPAQLSGDSLSPQQAACLDGIAQGSRDPAYVLERWKCINTGPRSDREAIPLVIVSSWGGGIRAAVWASMVMDCLFEAGSPLEGCQSPDSTSNGGSETSSDSDRILGLSGVSGGALGFVEYAAHVADRTTGTSIDPFWVEERLTDDYVSPTLAWMLYVDMPSHLLGFIDGVPDRADILEEAWERSWGDGGTLSQGFLSLWESNPRVPTVLANGTSFSDGCGFVSAPIAGMPTGTAHSLDMIEDCLTLLADPVDPDSPDSIDDISSFVGSKDLIPYLCDGQRDVRLSTAALLSARFPYVTPSGRVVRDCEASTDEISYVIDGGYREGSGSLTALQLWDSVEEAVWEFNATDPSSCIVPFMIHIENGYSAPTVDAGTPPVPNEWIVPIQGRVGDGLVTVSRATAAARFNEPVRRGSRTVDVELDGKMVTDRYVFITTKAHPGVSAPLGWTLSQESYDDLEKQLTVNQAEIAEVRSWLNGTLTCGNTD